MLLFLSFLRQLLVDLVILVGHGSEVIRFSSNPLSMLVPQGYSKLTAIGILSTHEPITVQTHSAAVPTAVPFWRTRQLHLKIDAMCPVVI